MAKVSNERVLELYVEALANLNALDFSMQGHVPGNYRRKAQALRRFNRIRRIIINRRMFGVNVSENGECLANGD
jgi:hypothetical protein